MEENEDQEDGLLNQYLKELIEIQDHALITEKDIAHLDEKYPLSTEEIDKIHMLAHRHVSRADQYKKQERWDTAIVETERALLFTPLDPDLRLDLAELYTLRSRQYGYLEKDLRRARNKVKETLILKPGYRSAIKLQKELQDLDRMLKGTDQNRKIIPLIIVLLIIMGAVLIPRIRNFAFWEIDEEETTSSNLPLEEQEWTRKELTLKPADSLKERLDIDIKGAELLKNNESYALSLSGYVQTLSGPLENLVLDLSLGDVMTPVLEKELSLLDKNDPILLPGETLPFSAYYHLTSYNNEESLQLGISAIGRSEALYDPSQWAESVPFWGIPRPNDINLTFTGKRHNLIEGYDRTYLFQDIKMANKSIASLENLKINAKWYDADKNEIASRLIDCTPPGSPPIKGESVQTFRVMLDLPKEQMHRMTEYALYIESIKRDE